MAAGIVYLDVDDEITSAAQRIRSSAATRVALVVPYGSRIATSRMNFRLLSREAIVSNRRLSIVSGDAASRALAASAGLPVFASVSEYEDAMEASGGPGGAARAGAAAGTLAASETIAAVGPPAPEPEPEADPARLAEATAAAAGLAAAAGRATAGPPAEPRPEAAPSDETARMAVPLAGAAGVAGATVATRSAPSPVTAPAPTSTVARPRPAAPSTSPGVLDGEFDGGRRAPRAPVLAGLAVAGLAIVVLAVAAWLFLPSASIAVTPRAEPISVELTVAADPTVTTADPAAGVVPAVRLDVPVETSQTFNTTGVHVEQTPASGEVTFSNYNPVSSNTVPAGSVVSTEGGIRFRTLAGVTIPAGTFVLPSVIPATRRVAVQAVKPGTEGNVPANAIRVVPQGENPEFLKVNNPNPTDGGTRTETPEITQAELDKAVAQLETQLHQTFEDTIAAGAGAPADTTLFPGTAVLGPSVPDPDPKTLVGQAVPTYDLALSATGSVIAVDPRPVNEIATQQLEDKIGADHQLVDGSIDVEVGEGTVGEDGQVSFQATARAQRIPILDPAVLRSLVKGKTQAEAEAALAPYGTAKVVLWPSWASTVTGFDSRLDLTVQGPPGASAGASPGPSTAPAASRPSSPGPSGSSAASAAP
jgi:hypothetical protein